MSLKAETGSELKMWYLKCDDYGYEWYTMAKSKIQALKNMIKLVEEKVIKNEPGCIAYESELEWLNKILESNFDLKYMNGYTFNSYAENEAIQSLVC